MFRSSFPASDEELETGTWLFFDELVPPERYGYIKEKEKMVRMSTNGHEVC